MDGIGIPRHAQSAIVMGISGNSCEKSDCRYIVNMTYYTMFWYHIYRHVLGGSTADALQGVSPSRRQSGQKNAPGDDFQQTATFDQLLAECHRSKYATSCFIFFLLKCQYLVVLSPHTFELLCYSFSTHEHLTNQCSQFCSMCMMGGTYEARWISKICNSEQGKVGYGVILPMTIFDTQFTARKNRAC